MKKGFSKWRQSKWRLSYYAFLAFIGGSIGASVVNPGLISVLGVLSGSLIMVIVNIFYVIYTNRKSKFKENKNT